MLLKNPTTVTDPQEIGNVLTVLDRVPKFSLDLETTGLDFNRSVIHGIALATEDQEWYVCLGAERALLPKLKSIIETKEIIGHNLAFDMHFLNKYGIIPPKIVDTMVGQWLVDENQRVGLKSLARTVLGVREPLPDFKELLHLAKKLLKKKRLEEVTIYDVPLDTLAEYACRDVRLTYDLLPKTLYQLNQQGLLDHFYNVEMPFVYLVMEMEEAGFFIDQAKMNQLAIDFKEKQDLSVHTWNKLTGGTVDAESPKQLAKYLFEVRKYKATRFTINNQPSTDIMSLVRLLPDDKNGEIKALIDYRHYSKLVSTYITSFQERIFNGRLYGNFNQTGTVTGRLSSSEPNLQNIPATGEAGSQVRDMFSAPTGYWFLDADYSQIELRLLAHYTKDANMMKVFEENGDPHQMTADLIGIPRKPAKSVNFGWAYGIGPRKLQDSIEKATGVRPTVQEAADYLEGFSRVYPGAPRWKYRVINAARELGYVKTITGRRRHLPEINSNDKALSGSAERQAVNSIIQGSAADIIKWAMLNLRHIYKAHGVKMNSQVHDEITAEVPDEVTKETKAKTQEIMERAGEFFNLRVKLIAAPGLGKSWGSAKGE